MYLQTSIIFILLGVSIAEKPCIQRWYNYTSFVCVCNSTYCDEIDEVKPLPRGLYVLYTSSEEQHRLHRSVDEMKNNFTFVDISKQNDFVYLYRFLMSGQFGNIVMKINREKKFQTINGFGASTTDSSGYVISKLSNETRENLLRSYFSNTGIEYNILRSPIGGTDFSLRPYTYNTYPENDITLSNFTLQDEDYLYKIPVLQGAQRLATDKVLLTAAAWGPPPWMKSNNHFGGPSRLKKKYFQTWADYHIRYLKEYEKLGFTYWAISPGNEPGNGVTGFEDTVSLGWRYKEYVYWIGHHFGPTIRNSNYSYLKIIILDDCKNLLPWVVPWVARDKKASKYFDGISTHYYFDYFVPTSIIDDVHNANPDKFFIMSEASYGTQPHEVKTVALGLWSSAEWYFNNILLNLNHWHTGWLDWNMCLNMEGGPKWTSNHVDASVIVDTENDEILKQPMFYAIGHFSKFLTRGSVRIEIELVNGNIDCVGFLRPDGGIVVIFHNPFPSNRHVVIFEEDIGYIELDVLSQTFHTLLYW